jgi:hypothetical protein
MVDGPMLKLDSSLGVSSTFARWRLRALRGLEDPNEAKLSELNDPESSDESELPLGLLRRVPCCDVVAGSREQAWFESDAASNTSTDRLPSAFVLSLIRVRLASVFITIVKS